MEPAGLYIALPIEINGAHITVVIRHMTEPHDKTRFERILVEDIKPMLPIVAQIGKDIVMRGYNDDVPTHDIKLLNPEKEYLLGAIYEREYRQLPEYKQFPKLSLHVTVDSDAKREKVNKILKERDGVVVLRIATLKEIGNKALIAKVVQ